MKIINEGQFTFILDKAEAWAFNLDAITRMRAEDCERAFGCEKGLVFITVWTTGGGHPATMKMPYAEARQVFADTVWEHLFTEVSS